MKAVIAFIILFPLIGIFSASFSLFEQKGALVGIVLGNNEFIFDNEENSYVKFKIFEYEQELKNNILNGKIDWGYVLCDNLKQKILSDDNDSIIKVYEPANTVSSKLTDEVIFAEIAEAVDLEILLNYADKTDMIPLSMKQKSKEYIQERYNYYKNSDAVYSFEYETIGEDKEYNDKYVFPLKAVISIIIFSAGLFAAAKVFEDEKKGIYKRFNNNTKILFSFISIFTVVLILGIFGIIAMYIGKLNINIEEIFKTLIYIFSVTCFSFFVKSILRNKEFLYGAIPIIILSSLIFCPVFIDISLYIKSIAFIQKILIPYYYIKETNGILIVGIIFLFAGVLYEKLRCH